MSAILSLDETKRLAAVRRYNILDTPPDGAFDNITRLAARLFNVPISIVSIVDHDRIWFKSHHGLDVEEIPISPGLCASAIMFNEPWVVTDASLDPRALANPLVAGELGLRFYAGVQLRTSDGFNLGTLCVIDHNPRQIGDAELENLRDFAAIVMNEIELRRSARQAIQLESEMQHLARLGTMGQMAAVLAHEINQPLTAIIGYVEASQRLLNGGELKSGQVRQLMEKASDQALRAGETVRRVREFVARGRKDVRPHRVASIIQEASALGLVGAKQFGVEVHIEIDPKVGSVLVDRLQIQQVIVNLIRNAVEAMQETNTRVLDIAAGPSGRDMVEFNIADTGPGIAPEIASQLFQPFVTSKLDSMGIGLSICRNIIDAHGGRLWVEPRPGGGSIFRFTLPAAVNLGQLEPLGVSHLIQ